MILGVDFDNTLVCYERLFHAAALRQGLIPPEVPRSKNGVRDYLRSRGQEELWTRLQGYVYGKAIEDAPPFPGAAETLERLQREGAAIRIISHKTRRPLLGGEEYDLQEAARLWLGRNVLSRLSAPADVWFEETRVGKLRRVASTGCTHFIDDLPEFLNEGDFPRGAARILFDPEGRHRAWTGARFSAWDDLPRLLEALG